ncbi:hypothetical protein ABTI94_13965, partial [Acinetobacter baumannii]
FRGRLIHFEIILLNKLLMLGLCNKAQKNYLFSYQQYYIYVAPLNLNQKFDIYKFYLLKS